MVTTSEGVPQSVRVECYAGYRGEETPRRFFLNASKIEVMEIVDRWLAPEHRYFKLRGDDGDLYILRYGLPEEQWQLTFHALHLHNSQVDPAPISTTRSAILSSSISAITATIYGCWETASQVFPASCFRFKTLFIPQCRCVEHG